MALYALNLEAARALWVAREPLLAEIASLPSEIATRRMQEIYSEPIKPELIKARIGEIRAADVPVAAALSPKNTARFADTVGIDVHQVLATADHGPGGA